METKATGTVIAVKKQWWLKVNTKPSRKHALDGATFPYIISIEYMVDGTSYTKRKWIKAGDPIPEVGSTVEVLYDHSKPSKAKLL